MKYGFLYVITQQCFRFVTWSVFSWSDDMYADSDLSDARVAAFAYTDCMQSVSDADHEDNDDSFHRTYKCCVVVVLITEA